MNDITTRPDGDVEEVVRLRSALKALADEGQKRHEDQFGGSGALFARLATIESIARAALSRHQDQGHD